MRYDDVFQELEGGLTEKFLSPGMPETDSQAIETGRSLWLYFRKILQPVRAV